MSYIYLTKTLLKSYMLLKNKMFQVHCLFLLCMSLKVLTTNAAYIKSITKENEAQILSNEYKIEEDGNYSFSFKTSNGITRSETGLVIDKGQPNEHFLVFGRYTYFNTDGKKELFEYVADENGYRLSSPERVVVQTLPSSVVASLLGK